MITQYDTAQLGVDLDTQQAARSRGHRAVDWMYAQARALLVLLFSSGVVAAAVVWADAAPLMLVAKEIGYAGLIAVFLYFIFEKADRERHHEVISENMKGLQRLQRAIVKETLNSVYRSTAAQTGEGSD